MPKHADCRPTNMHNSSYQVCVLGNVYKLKIAEANGFKLYTTTMNNNI